MRKHRSNIVSLAERRQTARIKHDARASYQRLSSEFDQLRTRGQATTELNENAPSAKDIETLVNETLGEISGYLGAIEWAEEEITAACARHPADADRIWHVGLALFSVGAHEHLLLELLYRAHCRELLARVVAREDTRPGTAAEVICLLRYTSLLSPLTSAATALYMRMYQAAGLPEIPKFADMLIHYEAIKGSIIDDHEAEARRKLTVRDRVVPTDVTCSGQHHGEWVACSYAPRQLALVA
jgi:hypothetical protein